jgi:hypothetical protein
LFSKREVLVYKNVDIDLMIPQLMDYWTRMGFYVTQMSPHYLSGVAYGEEMGIRSQFNLTIFPRGEYTTFDLYTQGEIQTSSIVILVIIAVLLWPVALILGLVSYFKYDSRSKSSMYNFWGFLNHITGQAGVPPIGYYQSPPPPEQGWNYQQPEQPRRKKSSTK